MGDILSSVMGTDSSVQTGQSQKLGFQDYLPAINQAQGNYSQLYNQQQDLAKAFQAQMSGQGPNPAVSLLTQAQGQNAAQAAGMYANNRAINPALAARQAAMAQAQGNQVAANNAATLTAQQQLAASQNLSGLYGQMGTLTNQNMGLNQTAMANQNSAINQANNINAGVAAGNQKAAQNAMGGLLNGASSALMLAAAHGGMIPRMADGGAVAAGGSGPQSSVGKFLSGFGNGYDETMTNQPKTMGVALVPAMAKGGDPAGRVPGKASVQGDSLKNDKVPTMLSPGEIVIPRHITQSDDAPNKAKAFVAAVLAREGMKKK